MLADASRSDEETEETEDIISKENTFPSFKNVQVSLKRIAEPTTLSVSR